MFRKGKVATDDAMYIVMSGQTHRLAQETDGEKERQTHTEKHMERKRDRDSYTEKERQTHTEKHMERRETNTDTEK